jgi:RNA polymerase sigma factor (sigma-70 family)
LSRRGAGDTVAAVGAEPPIAVILDQLPRATLDERFAAVEALCAAVLPTVRSVIYRKAPPLAAEELYGATIDAIVAGLDRCRAQTEREFVGWCVRIARNKLADHFRAPRGLELVSLDADELTATLERQAQAEAVRPDELLALHDLLARMVSLDPECSSYLYRHYVEGWTFATLGELAGLSADAMRMRATRCLEKLRSLLAEER